MTNLQYIMAIISRRYAINYFIKKFRAIPDDKWAVNSFQNLMGQSCVLGHCGQRGDRLNKLTKDTKVLSRVLKVSPHEIILLNDGHSAGHKYQDIIWNRPGPRYVKKRILAALERAKFEA